MKRKDLDYKLKKIKKWRLFEIAFRRGLPSGIDNLPFLKEERQRFIYEARLREEKVDLEDYRYFLSNWVFSDSAWIGDHTLIPRRLPK